MGYRICYYTRHEQQKKRTGEVGAVREISNHARHGSHARTQTGNYIQVKGCQVAKFEQQKQKNQESIKQLIKQQKPAPASPPGQCYTVPSFLNNKS